jgi:hypothetical protein
MALRETTIAGFFAGDVSATDLDLEARAAIEHVDSVRTHIHIVDMPSESIITPDGLLRLIDAGIAEELTAESISAIAFTLVASDHFAWNDDIVAEIIHDWSAPEINYPLTPESLSRFRRWVLGEEPYPDKPNANAGQGGRLISTTAKVRG